MCTPVLVSLRSWQNICWIPATLWTNAKPFRPYWVKRQQHRQTSFFPVHLGLTRSSLEESLIKGENLQPRWERPICFLTTMHHWNLCIIKICASPIPPLVVEVSSKRQRSVNFRNDCQLLSTDYTECVWLKSLNICQTSKKATIKTRFFW